MYLFRCLVFIIPSIIYGQWVQVGQDLYGLDEGDFYGSHTEISGDGNTIAISGNNTTDNGEYHCGYVKVFKNEEGNWVQFGDAIYGTGAYDYSSTISLSNNGNILAIGGLGNDENGFNHGIVRVYENVSGSWQQIGNSIYGNTSFFDFGNSISLNDEGNILAVSAYYGNKVMIYRFVFGNWEQIGSDIIESEQASFFGGNISLNSEGNMIAIGAEHSNVNGMDRAGRVKVFENINDSWVQVGNDIVGDAAYDYLSRVSFNSQGNILAIAARQDYILSDNFTGYARVFKNVSGNWTQIGNDIRGALNDGVFNVSLNSEGNILAIGAEHAYGDNTSGYVEVYKSNEANEWILLENRVCGEALGDGIDIAINNEGNKFILGLPGSDIDGVNSGTARVFEYDTNFPSDIEVCNNYILPDLTAGNYYTLPNGNGEMLSPGLNITTNQTIYRYLGYNSTCPYNQSFTVSVINSPIIEVSDSFTPNGDSVNDSFIILNIEFYPNATLKVFNRWGDLLYEKTKGYSNDWNGESNKGGSGLLPTGSYYYMLNLGDNSGCHTNTKYNGWVYLNY
ncbi:gliding motility-associated C-terminal domain-containing protein [Pseudofulvibacter geojedonensis]|uniref:Gliding motility-associated C-terminal domain-containing protein n=1 Tax=Pseudofulvibacter geojedonensis TaxID=1123758 RepID=A0ABW3HY46_9FLAO